MSRVDIMEQSYRFLYNLTKEDYKKIKRKKALEFNRVSLIHLIDEKLIKQGKIYEYAHSAIEFLNDYFPYAKGDSLTVCISHIWKEFFLNETFKDAEPFIVTCTKNIKSVLESDNPHDKKIEAIKKIIVYLEKNRNIAHSKIKMMESCLRVLKNDMQKETFLLMLEQESKGEYNYHSAIGSVLLDRDSGTSELLNKVLTFLSEESDINDVIPLPLKGNDRSGSPSLKS